MVLATAATTEYCCCYRPVPGMIHIYLLYVIYMIYVCMYTYIPDMACLLCPYKYTPRLQRRFTLRVLFLRECGYICTAARTDEEMSSQEEREIL